MECHMRKREKSLLRKLLLLQLRMQNSQFCASTDTGHSSLPWSKIWVVSAKLVPVAVVAVVAFVVVVVVVVVTVAVVAVVLR